jgi:hypothetical protein
MARDKDYGATNEPRTCLWCGAQLRQITTWTGQFQTESIRRSTSRCCYVAIYLDPASGRYKCEQCGSDSAPYTKQRAVTAPTGTYGEDGDGLFCRTRCGYQFGRALAQHGRRLKPREERAS